MKIVGHNLPHLNFQVQGCAILYTNKNTDFFKSASRATISTGAEDTIVLAKSEKIPEP